MVADLVEMDPRLRVLADHLLDSGFLRSWSYLPSLPCPFVFQPKDPLHGGPSRGWASVIVSDLFSIPLDDIPLLLASGGLVGHLHTDNHLDRRFLEARLEIGV